MQKFLAAAILVAGIASITAYERTNETSPEIVVAPVVAAGTPTQASLTHKPALAVEPDIPTIVDELNFGVPAGNGDRPQQLAIDSQQRRLYSLNEGGSDQEGNTISVIELETGRITHLLTLNNMSAEDRWPPTPLDLQIDPYRPRLYALSGDRIADPSATSLTIIDTDTLTIVDTLTGVEAIAPGPDRLYLANDTLLWAVDPLSLAELSTHQLDLRPFNEPLQLNVEANRLYLGRGQPWSLEIFAAASLAPIGSYPVAGELIQAAVDQASQRVFIIENDDTQVILHTLDRDGQPVPDFPPVTLADNVYGDLPLAFTAQTLYLVEQETALYAYQLRSFSLPNLTPVHTLSLTNLPADMLVDPVTGRLYAVYSSPDSYLLAIDPATGATEVTYTALDIIDALVDPDSKRLYVLNNQGTLQILDLADYDRITQVDTGFNTTDPQNSALGELSLDSNRQRLYLSGDPVRTIDINTLEVRVHPDLRGQVTPDPTSDRVFLTPPCRCREEQCNTLILSADSLTGAETLFSPEDPLTASCVTATSLDYENQLLYATIYNGIPGSNSGDYFAVFDTQPSGPPEQIYTDFQISYGDVAFDSPNRRAFIPRSNHGQSFIHRFEFLGQTFTQTLELVGAAGQLTYDPQKDRLYAIADTDLQVFDGELALLAEITLPGEFELLAFDPRGQRLYLHGDSGQLLVVATDGGQLELPPPLSANFADYFLPVRFAPDGTRFRFDSGQFYRSRDQGQTWQVLGRGLPGRPINDLAFSPNYEQDQTLLVGLWNFERGGGLYRSTDGGDTWQPTTRGLTDLGIQQIVFSPTFGRDQTVFVTTFTRGLFRSTDGGHNWSSLASGYASDPVDHPVSHLAVSPNFAIDGLVIIGHNNLLRSTDGGDTWINTDLPAGLVAFSPDFATDHLVLSDGRWRSTDGGEIWQPAATGLELSRQTLDIFFSPGFTADQTVYILQQPEFGPSVSLQRSVDAGRTWQSLLGGLPESFNLKTVALLPTGELYLSGDEDQQLTIFPNTLAWGRLPVNIAQLDLQDLAVAPDGSIFVANSAAGVFKSVDGGETWLELDFPARASELELARLVVADDGTIFVAVGTIIERSTDGGETWTYLANLPTGFMVSSLAVSPDYEADGIVLAGGDYQQNQLIRSADRGATWEVVFDGTAIAGASDLSLIAFSPTFAATGEVYAWLQEAGLLRSSNGGRDWTLVANDQSRYADQSLAVSPDGERLYLGALDGHLLVSSDKGETWLDLKDNIPGNRVWSSALVLTPEGGILLGTDIGVFRSLDRGLTWTEASTGLPLDPDLGTPEGIRALHFRAGRVYAALTEGGLYISDNLGQTWYTPIAE